MVNIEQCGYCGRYFRGSEFLTSREINEYFSDDEFIKPPLGYCSDAQLEHAEQNPEERGQIITRDMAIDAGDPSLEGEIF